MFKSGASYREASSGCQKFREERDKNSGPWQNLHSTCRKSVLRPGTSRRLLSSAGKQPEDAVFSRRQYYQGQGCHTLGAAGPLRENVPHDLL